MKLDEVTCLQSVAKDLKVVVELILNKDHNSLELPDIFILAIYDILTGLGIKTDNTLLFLKSTLKQLYKFAELAEESITNHKPLQTPISASSICIIDNIALMLTGDKQYLNLLDSTWNNEYKYPPIFVTTIMLFALYVKIREKLNVGNSKQV